MTMQSHYKTLDAIRHGIFVVRADAPGYPIIFVNAAFVATTGRQPEDVLGQSCAWLYGGIDDAALGEHFTRSASEIQDGDTRYYIVMLDEPAGAAPAPDMGEIVHRLRGPLAACVAWIDLLGLTSPDSPEVASAVAAIKRNLDRQRQIIDDLLGDDRAPR
jgi:signal transduction histidine kinase